MLRRNDSSVSASSLRCNDATAVEVAWLRMVQETPGLAPGALEFGVDGALVEPFPQATPERRGAQEARG
ncbi:hypothetical protein [Nocardioides sp. CER19]|uniref:hypothetical protein n=1 Tax=Nocardioides sp. CER19 TaxID=3038538 RepID=UPI002449FF45|nr:hypothetical protein [Nocardioides sp. CER19]MDH2413042.1 hypothetical protein [Nocardioides sp. CER19]